MRKLPYNRQPRQSSFGERRLRIKDFFAFRHFPQSAQASRTTSSARMTATATVTDPSKPRPAGRRQDNQVIRTNPTGRLLERGIRWSTRCSKARCRTTRRFKPDQPVGSAGHLTVETHPSRATNAVSPKAYV